MNAATHDVIVLGAGSGGLAAALRAARHGARVALVEPGALGGTCVNVGCVPKKAMWIAADLAEAQSLAREVGFATTPGALDWSEYVTRRQRYIADIHASYRRRLAESGVECIAARGRFIASDRVVAGDRELRAPHVVVATGARPRRVAIEGGDLGIVSDGFFDLRAAPRRVAIVGGGYIAVELASVLHGLGSEVSIFTRGEFLLAGFDHEVTAELAEHLRAHGIGIGFDREPEAVVRDGDGFALHVRGGNETGFDALIWAVGRVPNSGDLGLDAIGVDTDRSGHVLVDALQDTNVSGVHAIGDVTDRIALTPVAVAAGRRLADRLFGGRPDSKLDYENIATVVFAHPPVAAVGLTERAARERHGDDIAIYRTRFRPMFGALTGLSEKTFVKMICAGRDERVVGLHMLGRGADEILQGFAVAIKAGACKRDFDETVAIHPTSAEELVLMGEMNRMPVI